MLRWLYNDIQHVHFDKVVQISCISTMLKDADEIHVSASYASSGISVSAPSRSRSSLDCDLSYYRNLPIAGISRELCICSKFC